MPIHATKSELEILNVMWAAGISLARSDILARSTEKTWKDNSIHILLNGMLKKELIAEAGFTRSGKVWGRLYAPLVTPEEQYCDVFLSPWLDPVKVLRLMLRREDMNRETLASMLELIQTADANGGQKTGL